MVLTTTLHCSSIRGDTLRAIQLSLDGNHGPHTSVRPEPLRTCPTLACMAYSLASWDAAMASHSITNRSILSSLPLKSQTLIKLQIFIGKRLTFYFNEFAVSNLPTIIPRPNVNIIFFKLSRFKTDYNQSLVEVSTRVKVPSTAISSA